MKRILLTGGGTAGHVTPNIALLPGLRELGYEISYMGSYDGIEKKLIEEFQIPYYGISSGKLRRYFDPKNFTDPFKVLKGYGEARRIIKKLKPDVLFSKGGNTPEILNYIPCAKAKGATIIGVTQNDGSTLAREADIYFKIVAEHECDMWDMCASASCNTIAAVWDAVAFTVMRYNGYTKDDLLLTHPGGKVGQMLRDER